MKIGTVKPYPQPSVENGGSARPEVKTRSGETMGGDGAANGNRQSGGAEGKKISGVGELTRAELDLIQQLKQADAAVRAHEMAHVTAGGQYVRSGARFQYERGPDGKSYAVAGEVSIDMGKVPGDPKATAEKMKAVQRAALAPRDPSAQDRRIAAQAAQMGAEAAMEYTLSRMRENKALAREEPVFRQYGAEKAYSADTTVQITGGTVDTFG
ncbi:MAG: putative metalloprotease CJM1_0395 family protein [Thermodesulfobacteriota bacterium]